MNRIYSVFLVVAASCSCAFAASTNIVGNGTETINLTNLQFSGIGEAPTNYAANVENVAELNVSGSMFSGGAGGSTATIGVIIDENGGAGLQLKDVGRVFVSDSVFRGGKGGTIDTQISSFPEVKGGHGIVLLGDFAIAPFSGVVAEGGEGGTVNNDLGRGKSFGGDGVSWVTLFGEGTAANIAISDGSYHGGEGGSAVYNSDEVIDENSEAGYFGDYNGTRGGHGLRVSNKDYLLYGTTVTIDGGSFTGGAGGSAQNSGSGDANSNGGHGIYVDFSDVVINGGEFAGGLGGSENEVQGTTGYGVRTRDSNLFITNGTFLKRGLFFESHYYDMTAKVFGGKFGEAIFAATFDEFDVGHKTINTINISGGTFESVLFTGKELNNVAITGGTIANLMLEGAGIKDLSLAMPATISSVVLNDGIANVNQWGDSHFANTKISNGTMNFNNQIFNLEDGSSFSLLGQGAVVNFNDGLVAKSNSAINIVYDGATSTAIKGSDLTFEEGAKWIIDGGETLIVKDDEVVMAEATGLLDASTNASFVSYLGSGGSWMGGITALEERGKQLIGTYGYVSLNKALGTTPGSDFDNAMTDLTSFLEDNDFEDSANYTEFKGMGDAADVILTDAYVRAPEMANTLIRLQGVFSDQIKDRTRSYLRQQEWGVVASSAPQGAQGPDAWDDSMGWLNDHLPKWDAREAMDRNGPPKAAKPHAPKAPRGKIEIPTTYQLWGRAYGLRIEQDATSGFGGYDANIGGGVVGMDKRFNNLLLGLGGGYAHTTVNGNWGSDGEADTGYGTVYAAVTGEKNFFDFNINYAFNDVETESSPLMQYSGDYNASTVGFYVGGGMGFDWGRVLFTPEASLLTTYYDRDSYTETSAAVGPYPDKEWGSYNEWSYLTSVGATLSMVGKIDNFNLNMEFRPEVRAHWLHEFNADMDDPTYMMVGGVNTIGVSLQAREEDLIKVGTGIRFSKWDSDTLEFGLDIDGAFGQDYAAYMVSGKLMHRF